VEPPSTLLATRLWPSGKNWDKKKKFLKGDGTGANNVKLVRMENGTRLPATYRSGRFDEWKSQHRVNLPDQIHMALLPPPHWECGSKNEIGQGVLPFGLVSLQLECFSSCSSSTKDRRIFMIRLGPSFCGGAIRCLVSLRHICVSFARHRLGNAWSGSTSVVEQVCPTRLLIGFSSSHTQDTTSS
jgi:DBP10CT (NUC160) domain